MIVCAAIKTSDGRVWGLMPPARHAEVAEHVIATTRRAVKLHDDKGFLVCSICTPRGRCHEEPHGLFVSRNAAEHIARQAGQLTKDLLGPYLTTDDLW